MRAYPLTLQLLYTCHPHPYLTCPSVRHAAASTPLRLCLQLSLTDAEGNVISRLTDHLHVDKLIVS